MEREAWLLARRSVVTATDVARLARGGPKVWADIRSEKDGTDQSRHVTRAMEWGTLREPALVRYAQTIDPTITPNSELWVDGDLGATPDGVGDGIVCECKTSSTPLDEIPARYMDQMQWQMRVTGTSHCLFVWEQCVDEGGVFHPIRIDYQWVDRDDTRIDWLEDIAHQFLADDTSVSWDALLTQHAIKTAEFQRAKAELDAVKDEIRDAIPDDQFKYVSDLGSISLSPATARQQVDTDALRADWPEIARKVTVTRTTQPRLTIRHSKDDEK